jgi:uncharacterized protein YjiS (DUF1127 family)
MMMQSPCPLLADPGVPLLRTPAFIREPIYQLSRLLAAIGSAWTTFNTWRRNQQAIKTLQQMDDHILADIGIPRAQIELVVKNRRRHHGRPRDAAWVRFPLDAALIGPRFSY